MYKDYAKKWFDFVDGKNWFLYGIPDKARIVVRFNKSLVEIEPNVSDGFVRVSLFSLSAIRSGIGSIYCVPFIDHHMLKITPKEGEKTNLTFFFVRNSQTLNIFILSGME